MHTNHPKEDPLVELGYESRDVNYKLLSRAVIGFFIFTAFSFGAGLLIYNTMMKPELRSTTARNAAVNRVLPKSPNPLLQDNVQAKTDMMDLRIQEDARLHGTGYADEAQTRVHIPIERAMDLLLERGLPTVGDGTAVPNERTGSTSTTPETLGSERPGGAGESVEPTPTPSTSGGTTNPSSASPSPHGAQGH